MIIKNKRGQGVLQKVLIGIIVIFVVAVGILAMADWKGTDSISQAINKVSEIAMDILTPLFKTLLNLGADTNTNFLIVLTFILISVIIISTLDSVNIFGDDKKGHLVNFIVGIIVSIIGTRFMPENMWASLTAPSSAFVATVLVAIPFLAMFFVSMKVKNRWAGKLLWIFYTIFMTYLVIRYAAEMGVTGKEFLGIYIAFLIAGGLMSFFDAGVRNLWYKAKADREVATLIGKSNILKKAKLRAKIEEWEDIVTDPNTPSDQAKIAKDTVSQLKELYKKIT